MADFSSADGSFHVTLTAKGDASSDSGFDTKFFTLTFTGPVGSSLRKASIDLGALGEDFDPSVDKGFPFTIGSASGVVKAALEESLSVGSGGTANGRLTIKLGDDAFLPDGTLAFGIDRDNVSLGYGGNSADLLAGATVKAKFVLVDGSTAKAVGTLTNMIGSGYSPDVGYGLIDAQAALAMLKGR